MTNFESVKKFMETFGKKSKKKLVFQTIKLPPLGMILLKRSWMN